MNAPANHHQNERFVIRLVETGELAIDPAGRIWRFAHRRGHRGGGSHLIVCEMPTRAEHPTDCGYLRLTARLDGRKLHALAHRLVWQHFVGDIPDGLTINHVNGDKTDNRPSNFELATYVEQVAHAYELGLRVDRRDALGRFTGRAA